MIRPTHAFLLTALAIALVCSLAALAAQGSELSALKNSNNPAEYRAEVAHMMVADRNTCTAWKNRTNPWPWSP